MISIVRDLIVAIILVCLGIHWYAQSLLKSREFLLKEVNQISIQILSENPSDCKEANMKLYWYLRSKGYEPLIQFGKKDGAGHLWIELNSRIYDVTDPKFNDSLTSNINYKLDQLLKR